MKNFSFYVLISILLIFSIQNFQFIDADIGTSTFECNVELDRNNDGVPDKIEPKSSINWAYCNLEGQDISKIKSFDYTDSDRPFDKLGIPYDRHEFEYNTNLKIEYYDYERVQNALTESFIEKIIRNIFEVFGKEYDKSENNNHFYQGAKFTRCKFTRCKFKKF